MRSPTLITCAKGMAPLLAAEVRALGFTVRREDVAAVETETDTAGLYRLCLCLRVAHRVLARLTGFEAATPDALYRALRRLPWEEWIPSDGYVRVHGHVVNEEIRDTRFAFMKIKDAVADRLRERTGQRPDSGPHDHGAAVYVHWVDTHATIYLDLAGIPLSKRGYRTKGGTAPLQEALAAAVLLAGGWTGDTPLLNPMCGSGTLAIEAALLARREAPCLYREYFALKHLCSFDRRVWDQEREAARRDIRPNGDVPAIVATDHDAGAVAFARENAKRAKVDHLIRFEVCDFRESPMPAGPAWVVMNPEYGKRMGEDKGLEAHYRDIGAWLKGLHGGGRGLVLTGNLPLAKRFGLKLALKHTLYNGPIECRLLGFDLF
jgi:23S rRNA G2445 N2-methylase RlmL